MTRSAPTLFGAISLFAILVLNGFGAVKYPLNNVVNGNSTMVISATLAFLRTGD